MRDRRSRQVTLGMTCRHFQGRRQNGAVSGELFPVVKYRIQFAELIVQYRFALALLPARNHSADSSCDYCLRRQLPILAPPSQATMVAYYERVL